MFVWYNLGGFSFEVFESSWCHTVLHTYTINMFIRVILQPADTINYSKVHRQEDAVRHNQSFSFSLSLFVMQYVFKCT